MPSTGGWHPFAVSAVCALLDTVRARTGPASTGQCLRQTCGNRFGASMTNAEGLSLTGLEQ